MEQDSKSVVWEELQHNDALVLDLALLFVSCKKANTRPDHARVLDLVRRSLRSDGTAPEE